MAFMNVLVVGIVIAITFEVGAIDPGTAPKNNGFRNNILEMHNALRQKEEGGLNDLEWNNKLARRSKQLAKKCKWAHSGDAERGENIWSGQLYSQMVDATQNWYGEKPDWSFQNKNCTEGKDCGHYTQVVWKTTTAVGCAFNYCEGLKYPILLFCQYTPNGNIKGQNPY
ncbi:uncharacterized protein LOC141904739 [Tubulanus polymorphus]|uniref:uncharacterized protein LOC141904739 n=1 Tax=Tubulanus polymorphus TaxID=672921 RepID=UPI003DA4F87C